MFNLDGLDPPPGAPMLLPNTGLLTLTHFEGDNVFFTTESGQFGSYSLTTKQATFHNVQAFSPPIDNPPTINRANAGRTIPVKWRLTDAAGTPPPRS